MNDAPKIATRQTNQTNPPAAVDGGTTALPDVRDARPAATEQDCSL